MTMQRGDLKVEVEADGSIMVGRPYEGLQLDAEEARWLMVASLPAALVQAAAIERAE